MAVAIAGAAGSIWGCDAGTQHDQPIAGPPLHLVLSNVGPSHPLPADGAIDLAFDRMLLPSSVTRQSIALVDAMNVPLAPVITYDPVTRVVRLSSPAANPGSGGSPWLEPNQPYKVLLGAPSGPDAELGGLRAIDRTTLAGATPTAPLVLGFLTTPANGDAAKTIAVPPIQFCTDVLPVLARSCAGSTCHNPPSVTTSPPQGLVLTTSAGVANTAIGHASHEVNTGTRAATAPPGRVFAVDMPIVDPGDPGNSYLIYKTLLATLPTPAQETMQPTKLTCSRGGPTLTPPFVYSQPGFALLADDERERLNDYIRGQPMPYPNVPGVDDPTSNLSLAEIERLRAWIAQGATVTECGTCQ